MIKNFIEKDTIVSNCPNIIKVHFFISFPITQLDKALKYQMTNEIEKNFSSYFSQFAHINNHLVLIIS